MFHVCQRCGRVLTAPRSQARGYGPTCWRAVTADEHAGTVIWIAGPRTPAGKDAELGQLRFTGPQWSPRPIRLRS